MIVLPQSRVAHRVVVKYSRVDAAPSDLTLVLHSTQMEAYSMYSYVTYIYN